MRFELIFLLSALLAAGLVAAAPQARDALGDPLPVGAIQRLGTLRLQVAVADLSYLPDGRAVLAVGNSLEIWDGARGELVDRRKVSDASLVSLDLRRDGKALLLADGAGNVREWDLVAKKELRRWETGQKSLRFACYSPDERRVLSTGALPPTLKEWDLETGRERIAISGKMAYFQRGIYAGDGKTALVGGGYENILAHYDLTTGGLLKEWYGDYAVSGLVLSPDGKRLLVGSRSLATEWEVEGYKLLRELRGHQGGQVTSQAYCRESDQLLTGSRDGSIRRWNRLTGEVLLRWFPHPSYVTNVRVSPDGRWGLSYGAGFVIETSLETGKPRLPWDRHTGAVEAAAFLPSGQQVVSGSSDDTLRIWDVATGRTVRLIEGAHLGAYAVAVSSDGKKVAAGCKDGVVREFKVADGKLLRELKGHLGYVRSLAYSPEGAYLFSSADDGSVRVWTPEQSEAVSRLEGHQGGALSIAVSRDGKFLLSGGRDGTVRLWDLAAGRLLHTHAGHRGWVNGVAFAGNAQQALSAGRDGRVLKWDLSTRKIMAELSHGAWVFALAVKPDGTRAYSAGEDGRIILWDLASGKQADVFAGHARPVQSLAVSPDGKRLLSGSADMTLLVWQLP